MLRSPISTERICKTCCCIRNARTCCKCMSTTYFELFAHANLSPCASNALCIRVLYPFFIVLDRQWRAHCSKCSMGSGILTDNSDDLPLPPPSFTVDPQSFISESSQHPSALRSIPVSRWTPLITRRPARIMPNCGRILMRYPRMPGDFDFPALFAALFLTCWAFLPMPFPQFFHTFLQSRRHVGWALSIFNRDIRKRLHGYVGIVHLGNNQPTPI